MCTGVPSFETNSVFCITQPKSLRSIMVLNVKVSNNSYSLIWELIELQHFIKIIYVLEFNSQFVQNIGQTINPVHITNFEKQ